MRLSREPAGFTLQDSSVRTAHGKSIARVSPRPETKGKVSTCKDNEAPGIYREAV
jgi:hypothetical protein